MSDISIYGMPILSEEEHCNKVPFTKILAATDCDQNGEGFASFIDIDKLNLDPADIIQIMVDYFNQSGVQVPTAAEVCAYLGSLPQKTPLAGTDKIVLGSCEYGTIADLLTYIQANLPVVVSTSGNTLTVSVGPNSDTAPIINTNDLSNTGLVITSTVNGITDSTDITSDVQALITSNTDSVTNTVAGHLIATHTAVDNTVININETVTSLSDGVVNGTVVSIPFTNENGTTINSNTDLAPLMNSAVFQSNDDQVLTAGATSDMDVQLVPTTVTDPDSQIDKVNYEISVTPKTTVICSGNPLSPTNKLLTSDTLDTNVDAPANIVSGPDPLNPVNEFIKATKVNVGCNEDIYVPNHSCADLTPYQEGINTPPILELEANNGTSISGGKVVLGNDIGGTDATLLSDREIPMNTFDIVFDRPNGSPHKITSSNETASEIGNSLYILGDNDGNQSGISLLVNGAYRKKDKAAFYQNTKSATTGEDFTIYQFSGAEGNGIIQDSSFEDILNFNNSQVHIIRGGRWNKTTSKMPILAASSNTGDYYIGVTGWKTGVSNISELPPPSNSVNDEALMIDKTTGQLKRSIGYTITHAKITSTITYTPTGSYVNYSGDGLNYSYTNTSNKVQHITIKGDELLIAYANAGTYWNYEYYDDIVSSVDNGTGPNTRVLYDGVFDSDPIASTTNQGFGSNYYSVMLLPGNSVNFTNNTILVGTGSTTTLTSYRTYIVSIETF